MEGFFPILIFMMELLGAVVMFILALGSFMALVGVIGALLFIMVREGWRLGKETLGNMKGGY